MRDMVFQKDLLSISMVGSATGGLCRAERGEKLLNWEELDMIPLNIRNPGMLYMRIRLP
jgi:hypothetical protein